MAGRAERGHPGSEGSEQTSIDQMTLLQEQRARRALGVVRKPMSGRSRENPQPEWRKCCQNDHAK
jgi:hypothetical protein